MLPSVQVPAYHSSFWVYLKTSKVHEFNKLYGHADLFVILQAYWLPVSAYMLAGLNWGQAELQISLHVPAFIQNLCDYFGACA